MLPRMKQGHGEVGDGVHRSDVRALFQIATSAAQTEVVRIIRPTVLTGDDVIDLVRNDRGLLGKMAVLARTLSAALDQLPYCARHLHEAARIVQSPSAWSRSRLRVSFSFTISS